MAITAKTEKVVPIHQKTKKKVLSVPVSSVRQYVDQPRTEFDDDALKALADSIVEHGLRQPISVVALENCRHNFELVDGERRWRAHQLAGIEYIEVIVDYQTQSGEQHLQSLISNFNRKNHTPMEISNAFVTERVSGTPVESLSKACGKSIAWVYQHLALQNLHHNLQKLMTQRSRNKKLSFNLAVELSKIAIDDQPAVYKEVQKIKGGAARMRFVQSASGREIIPRQKRPARDAKNIQNFAHRMEVGVDRFAGMSQDAFRAMISKLSPMESDVLIDQLESGAEALEELASFIKNFRTK